MILDQILADRKKAVERLKEIATLADFEEKIEGATYKSYSFKKALKNSELPIRMIAEIKKASPSKGVISEIFPYLEIAKAYERGQATALSVLTEPKYFQGDNAYLSAIKQTVKLPVLRKDFIVDPIQIYEAKAIGADAILLIVAALPLSNLQYYLELAKTLKLDCLVETHNEREVETALEAGAEIIGINNRNLQTFEVHLETTEKLRRLVPKEKVVVAESGIHTEEDIRRMKRLEVDALLIGESLMQAAYPEAQLMKFMKA